MNAALVISARDNVATALEPLAAGRELRIGEVTIVTTEAIPRGHKVALRSIRAGEPVIKYGSPIGTASADIAAGEHVHTHNVASGRGRGDLAAKATGESRGAADPRIAEPAEAEEPETAAARNRS